MHYDDAYMMTMRVYDHYYNADGDDDDGDELYDGDDGNHAYHYYDYDEYFMIVLMTHIND